jgi:serine/threonine protein kinase
MMKIIVKQIVNGLNEIHSRGIMHRDIKPDNIFLMKNGKIMIGDFSLSRKFVSSKNIKI